MSISRRSLLKGMAATSAVAATAGCATSPNTLTASDSNTPQEEQPNLLIVFPERCVPTR
ncbi:twin-arginine translocation signal domain-containing protein [Photobacterium sanguinicancri]|uniref:twin-arginine translocation signal domain-containing protein n=1 Tax=Photobacterium sanguinicancri TaxID=875932 RepID=UPI000ACBD6EC|nr:twin-arginine translocation signal domain-containing protein [Photobacterium sanguinicancri]